MCDKAQTGKTCGCGASAFCDKGEAQPASGKVNMTFREQIYQRFNDVLKRMLDSTDYRAWCEAHALESLREMSGVTEQMVGVKPEDVTINKKRVSMGMEPLPSVSQAQGKREGLGFVDGLGFSQAYLVYEHNGIQIGGDIITGLTPEQMMMALFRLGDQINNTFIKKGSTAFQGVPVTELESLYEQLEGCSHGPMVRFKRDGAPKENLIAMQDSAIESQTAMLTHVYRAVKRWLRK